MTKAAEKYKKLFEAYDMNTCQNGALLFRTESGSISEFDSLASKITHMGFFVYELREEAGNKFADLYHRESDTQIHLCCFSATSELKAIVTQGEALPPQATEYCKRVAPMITQVKQAYCKADCGMSYVIRLSDGRFVIIDGGFDEYEEQERLFDILQRQNTVYDKPTIAAWLVTHAHDDHFTCFVKLMETHGKDIELEYMVYNWATSDMCEYLCAHDEVDALTAGLNKKGCKLFTPHTGHRMCFADAVFDVLFACEDLLPAGVRGFNNTSTVFRMELGGKRVLWLGDTEGPASEKICAHFPAESLKCDFLQVGHHGYWGGSPELYRRADPSVLLWPCPDFWYHVIRDWSCNEFLVTSENIQKIFVSGRYTTEIDLTAPVPPVPSEPEYLPGDVIKEWSMENFSRVIDLNWSCVNGGQTGYRTPNIYFAEKGTCVIDAQQKTSLVELLRPGLLENAESYRLSLEGEVLQCCEQVGILYNEPAPTVPNMESVLMLDVGAEQALSLKLCLSKENKTASLQVNGEHICTVSYIPGERRGLYLYLKNAVVAVKTIRAVR